MSLKRYRYCLLFVLWGLLSFPVYAQEAVTTLYQTVERALAFSPQLEGLAHSNQAIAYDLKQARAAYGPSVDLLLGYGAGQYSDTTTRQPGADPDDSDWRSRGDATLRLTQKVYDGQTIKNVSIQQAILASADYELNEATQAIALDAISAHLDVYRQRKLEVLAQKDLQVHQDIYRALADIEKAGAGDIANVTQTQARLAQARSILSINQSELRSAIATYERVVGAPPEALAFAAVPKTIPVSLDDALSKMEDKNPGLLARKAILTEAEARVDLARAAYQPKINIELSSRYYDQREGDPSWQYSNDAMLVMRWNLFNGGQDKQAVNAAMSRQHRSRADIDDKLIELSESTTRAWTEFLSLQDQKNSFREAVASSKQTFDAYLQQYSVSRRSLLDVLNAEKEYFLSARELVNTSVDEILAAYRLLSLTGELQVPEDSEVLETPDDLDRLSEDFILPKVFQSSPSENNPANENLFKVPANDLSFRDGRTTAFKSTAMNSPITREDATTMVVIGPCINEEILKQAINKLQEHGFEAHRTLDTRSVAFTRLLEGRYAPDAAYARLEVLKKSLDAFVLREGDLLAIYVGSFQNHDNAIRYAQRLAQQNITVTPVAAEIEKQATMLVVEAAEPSAVEVITEQMNALGLPVEMPPHNS